MPSQKNVRNASLIEQQFWLLDQQGRGAAYNVISAFEFSELNVDTFVSVVTSVISECDVFNSSYQLVDGQLQCKYLKATGFCTQKKYPRYTECRELAGQWLTSQSQAEFNLDGDSLVRLSIVSFDDSDITLVSLVFHHIVIDLKTKDRVAEEISLRYNNEASSSSVQDAKNYQDFSQEPSPKASLFDTARRYWRQNLEGVGRQLSIPSSCDKNLAGPGFIDLNISPSLWLNICHFAKANTTSPYIVLLSAYFQLIAKFSGEKDFCIAVPLSNRKNASYKNTLGCFVNTLPLRLSINPDDSFQGLITKVRKSLLGAHRYQELPSISILEEANKANDNKGALYSHGFTFEHPMALCLNNTSANNILINASQTQLDLFIRCWEKGGQLQGQLEFGPEHDSVFAQRFVESYKVFIQNAMQGKDSLAGLLSCVPNKDQAVIAQANATDKHYPLGATLKSLFETQVEATPDATALVMGDVQLSYQAFNDRANALSHYLINHSVEPATTVVVLLERSIDMMVAIYAVVKAGAAYLPIDIELPEDRINYMLSNAGVSVVLTTSPVLSDRKLQCHSVVELDSLNMQESNTLISNPDVKVEPESSAYIIYTSGSTGAPKGVINSHSGICNRLFWMQDQFSIGCGDVALQKTPYSFDVSVWELFWPLQVGATLALADHGSHRDPYQLNQQIEQYGVSIIHFVPAMLTSYLSIEWDKSETPINTVICSGEELTLGLQTKFFNTFTGSKLFNLYGPTEAAVDVTCWECLPQSQAHTVPIGRPIANTQIHIVDAFLQPLPIGVMGELWIAGPQVAKGYVNNPSLTSECFINNPFKEGVIYKTGDYARWNEQGVIEFLGRKDHQVKLNGVRIELVEIENALLLHADIKHCIVQVLNSESGVRFLTAFYSCKNGNVATEKKALVDFLRQQLPAYMIPSHFVCVQSFELTSSGKVDRNKLPKTLGAVGESDPAAVGKQAGDVEAIILSVWEDVLGIKGHGLDETFFDVGGNSLLLMSVFTRLNTRFPNTLTSVDLFTYPTIQSLASHLRLGGVVKTTIKQSKSRASMMRGATARASQRRRPNRSPKI